MNFSVKTVTVVFGWTEDILLHIRDFQQVFFYIYFEDSFRKILRVGGTIADSGKGTVN